MRRQVKTGEEGNELGSEEYEGLADAFGKGGAGSSEGAGGFVEYLIFGCEMSVMGLTTDFRRG